MSETTNNAAPVIDELRARAEATEPRVAARLPQRADHPLPRAARDAVDVAEEVVVARLTLEEKGRLQRIRNTVGTRALENGAANIARLKASRS